MLIGRERWRRAGGWQDLLDALCASEPHLRTRLAGAEPLDPRPLSIARVPYGFLHQAGTDHPGVFRLGDQMAVIPSFTGSGMAIALHSAMLAAEAHLAGEPATLYAARMRRDVARQMARATALHRIGRSSVGQGVLMQLATAWPGLLGLANRLTRLPVRAAA
jgi:flavin-dependent dehydrogenase